ncbi:MAG: GAF domain-containing protein [Candidatus Desulforudis sp.]|nr:GAF domain-containing protein [Desulforudis sp.]
MYQFEGKPADRIEAYQLLLAQAQALLEGESDFIANCANISALLNLFVEKINWVGFYLSKNNELVLGPFQGNPACVRIPFDRGVCGKAASTKTVQRIDNVHLFPGHIACDSASNSELVIPMIKDGLVIGVLDIDSPVFSRFDSTDITWLSKIVELLTQSVSD